MFAVSDKVVCVREGWTYPQMFSSLPIKDTVYVIRECFAHPEGPTAVRLVGIRGQIHPINGEWAFRADHFRKLAEIKAENALRAAIDQSLYHP